MCYENKIKYGFNMFQLCMVYDMINDNDNYMI